MTVTCTPQLSTVDHQTFPGPAPEVPYLANRGCARVCVLVRDRYPPLLEKRDVGV